MTTKQMIVQFRRIDGFVEDLLFLSVTSDKTCTAGTVHVTAFRENLRRN